MHLATFPTPAAFFDAVLGPQQHNAHVECWRGHLWLAERLSCSQRGDAAVNEFVAQIREREAQRIAADYNYHVTPIAAALARWQSGCFSTEGHRDMRAARIRQLSRALDIAVERAAMGTAAE